MKKILYLCITALLALNLFGCSSFPDKKGTLFSSYNKILVNPLSFDAINLNNIDSMDVLAFYNSRPVLVKAFNDNFIKYAYKTGYFDEVLFQGSPDQGIIILEPVLSVMDLGPTRQWSIPAKGEIVCRLKDGVTGRVLGSYTVQRSVERSYRSNLMGTVSRLISEMGQDAAVHMAEAR
jgi:hypothetical protein